jgi:hypothetical protein
MDERAKRQTNGQNVYTGEPRQDGPMSVELKVG